MQNMSITSSANGNVFSSNLTGVLLVKVFGVGSDMYVYPPSVPVTVLQNLLFIKEAILSVSEVRVAKPDHEGCPFNCRWKGVIAQPPRWVINLPTTSSSRRNSVIPKKKKMFWRFVKTIVLT